MEHRRGEATAGLDGQEGGCAVVVAKGGAMNDGSKRRYVDEESVGSGLK